MITREYLTSAIFSCLYWCIFNGPQPLFSRSIAVLMKSDAVFTSLGAPRVYNVPSICHIWRAFPYPSHEVASDGSSNNSTDQLDLGKEIKQRIAIARNTLTKTDVRSKVSLVARKWNEEVLIRAKVDCDLLLSVKCIEIAHLEHVLRGTGYRLV